MENISKIVEGISKCYIGEKANDKIIENYEKQLGLKFSGAYKIYLKEYGSLSFYGTELSGITGTKYDDVAYLTEKLRKKDKQIPSEYYVVEDLASDGIVMLSNSNDNVFEYANGHISKKYNTFLEYIKTCKNREQH